jgi:hypothetical protein
MRRDFFLSGKFLSILLLLCCLLTAEEAIHFLRSHPNRLNYDQAATKNFGCVPRDAGRRLFLCPIPGYGTMVFLCSDKHCFPKEPTTGLTITPAEEKLLRDL